MNNLHHYRASIAPVPSHVSRPLWSVMIPTYNCAEYLRESLSSVLDQDPGPDRMQIEVVDDHSTTDDPEAVVKELGGERVGFYRQRENVGFIRNFETCLKRSRGKLVHLLHGDDYVRSGFYSQLQRAFVNNNKVGAAFCRAIYIDEQGHWQSLSPLEKTENGILKDWLLKIAGGQRIATPSVVVRRQVYENLGGFDRRISCAGEDWEMWVRIAAHYPMWYEPEPLAAYRMKRSGALTEQTAFSNPLVEDMCLAADIIESYLPKYLPEEQARSLVLRARREYAGWALEAAREVLAKGNLLAPATHMRIALECSSSPPILRAILRIIVKEVASRAGRRAQGIINTLQQSAASFLNRS